MGVASVADDQRKEQKGVILEAHKDKKKVHFGTRMDICHLKNAELEPKYQKYKGRVVLRSDMVKDDSGSYAVLTEQGSYASEMPAAKVMDVIARQPDCAGQAVDAVSACTQVKLEDASKLLKIPKSECPDLWIRLPRHQWPKSWSNIEDPRFLSNEICTDTYLLASCGKASLRKFFWNLDGKKCRIKNVCLFIEIKDCSYRKTRMILKWLEESKIWLPRGRN